VPVTEIRAGMIIGPGSAAYEVIRDLVNHLPAMITPAWVRSRSTPIALPDLLGDAAVLDRARNAFSGLPEAVRGALDELRNLADAVAQRCEHVTLRFDLCELTGYGYHTGPVFAAYSENFGRAVARGGRYDGVGVSFGRARPATGFDVDLKRLPRIPDEKMSRAIWTPGLRWVNAKRRGALWETIRKLRDAGERVIGALDEHEEPAHGCDRKLAWQNNAWRVQKLER